jgi:hypothetical protein
VRYLRRLVSGTCAQLTDVVQSLAARPFLPAERNDDDLFIVEFPKSGVTWLTFLIANVNAQLNGDPRAVTFFNVNDFVPDVQSVRHVGPARAAMPGYRCFKSHSPYLSSYRKVIYLVRDPRDVMASYWTFLRGLGWWGGTLEQLVAHRKYGIRAWMDHVGGWLRGIDAATSFALLRYEDLTANTSAELTHLYALLGLPVTPGIIATAIERSSIERMRQLERSFAASHPALGGLEFVRQQPLGGARTPISSAARELIEREAVSVMKQLGYGPVGALEPAPWRESGG